jgi:hypothetical protein
MAHLCFLDGFALGRSCSFEPFHPPRYLHASLDRSSIVDYLSIDFAAGLRVVGWPVGVPASAAQTIVARRASSPLRTWHVVT